MRFFLLLLQLIFSTAFYDLVCHCLSLPEKREMLRLLSFFFLFSGFRHRFSLALLIRNPCIFGLFRSLVTTKLLPREVQIAILVLNVPPHHPVRKFILTLLLEVCEHLVHSKAPIFVDIQFYELVSLQLCLTDVHDFNAEIKCRVSWDQVHKPCFAVCHLRWDDQIHLCALAYSEQSLLPALHELSGTNLFSVNHAAAVV
mmetsp:Transcript_11248/g.18850  ORF Transcript_11248/g.18850 Transcript_11248/m.18850 type:complete len:200 (+) Transcript_11248:682-1281(+)